MQVREKVEKSRNVVFFQWFVAPEGRRVGSLKRRVRSHLARCEINHCTPLWREAHFQVKRAKNWQVRSTFGRSDVVSRGRRKGLCTLSKISKTWSFVAFPSTMAGVGHLKRICKDAFSIIFRGRRSARDMFIRDVRRSGRWFPWEGCILEHQIFSFGKMILCDRCSALYDPASLFRGRRNTSETWTGKIAKRSGTRPSALHSTFHY